ncbi:MAG: hypothetical protein OXL96_05960 [Candidatus Poribacteria bacterium]|nr:hypothetical protein [Candidatus Poribacteria bacterium]
MRSEAKRESVFYVALVVALLLGLVACSPSGGGPTGAAVNVTGYWVNSLNTNFYRLRQSGSEVMGEHYTTLGGQALGIADYVYECGLVGGQVSGRMLNLEIVMTLQNCPTLAGAGIIVSGGEMRVTFNGQVKGDSFSGSSTVVITNTVGGVEMTETEMGTIRLENVESTDLRVQYRLD